jgi:hypothetical protein
MAGAASDRSIFHVHCECEIMHHLVESLVAEKGRHAMDHTKYSQRFISPHYAARTATFPGAID